MALPYRGECPSESKDFRLFREVAVEPAIKLLKKKLEKPLHIFSPETKEAFIFGQREAQK
ncbi:unnamed protein product [Leptidea sinapis]|uniref:Uncharacterized protein n=1 Tax=Leptidea sinapis TaxID=189913 RepID=A0A5E4R2I1_9NEOP|nr:unnamed protein product [Leptidea sinapis]